MVRGLEATLEENASGDTLEGRDAIRKDHDMLDMWAHANLMKFNQFKCKVLHGDQSNPKHKYSLGGEWNESNSEEQDLAVFIDEKLNMSQ